MKAYEDMNFIQKIIYKFRLRKLLKKVNLNDLQKYISYQVFQEKNQIDDSNYINYLEDYFNANCKR